MTNERLRLLKLDRHQVTTLLTLVIVVFWIISAVARIWISWPEAAVLDAAMAPIIGFWFLSAAKNGTFKNGKAVTP